MLTQYILKTSDTQDMRLQMRHAVDAGCQWIEIKAHSSVSDADISATVEDFRTELAGNNAVLIIADRYELARDIKADGVHMYSRDTPVSKVRLALEAWPILGVSVRNADDVAMLRGHDVDYIFREAEGGFDADTAAADDVTAIAAALNEKVIEAPLVAPGGIGLHNAMKLIEAGANALAIDASIDSSGSRLTESIREFINKLS